MNLHNNKSLQDEAYDQYVSSFKGYDAKEGSNRLYKQYHAALHRYVRRFPTNATILDAGCGDGELLEILCKHGYSNAEGVDLSEEQITLARKRNVQVSQGDLFEYLEKQTATYDLIIAVDLAEHFTKEEGQRLFSYMYRALKPDGGILLRTPNGQGAFPGGVIHGDLTHHTIYAPSSIAQMLRLQGFQHITCRESPPYFRGLIGGIRSILWLLFRILPLVFKMVETGKVQKIWTENMVVFALKYND